MRSTEQKTVFEDVQRWVRKHKRAFLYPRGVLPRHCPGGWEFDLHYRGHRMPWVGVSRDFDPLMFSSFTLKGGVPVVVARRVTPRGPTTLAPWPQVRYFLPEDFAAHLGMLVEQLKTAGHPYYGTLPVEDFCYTLRFSRDLGVWGAETLAHDALYAADVAEAWGVHPARF